MFEIKDAKSISDRLAQILEKLSAADQYFANLSANLATSCIQMDQQHAAINNPSAQTDQQHATLHN